MENANTNQLPMHGAYMNDPMLVDALLLFVDKENHHHHSNNNGKENMTLPTNQQVNRYMHQHHQQQKAFPTMMMMENIKPERLSPVISQTTIPTTTTSHIMEVDQESSSSKEDSNNFPKTRLDQVIQHNQATAVQKQQKKSMKASLKKCTYAGRRQELDSLREEARELEEKLHALEWNVGQGPVGEKDEADDSTVAKSRRRLAREKLNITAAEEENARLREAIAHQQYQIGNLRVMLGSCPVNEVQGIRSFASF